MKTTTLMLIAFMCFTKVNAQTQKSDTLKVYTSYLEALKHPDEVYKLDLSDLKCDFDTLNLSAFKNLTYLRFHHDSLTMVPKSVLTLTHIKVLDLSDNYIQTLPRKIRALTTLEELDLTGNSSFDLSKSMRTLTHMPRLKMLYLTDYTTASDSYAMYKNKTMQFDHKGKQTKLTSLFTKHSKNQLYTQPNSQFSILFLSPADKTPFAYDSQNTAYSQSVNQAMTSTKSFLSQNNTIFDSATGETKDKQPAQPAMYFTAPSLLIDAAAVYRFKNIPVEGHTNPGAGFRFSF